MSGGSQGTQSSTTTTSLPKWEQPYAKSYLSQLGQQVDPNGQLAPYNPALNQQVAPFTGAQNQALAAEAAAKQPAKQPVKRTPKRSVPRPAGKRR